MSGLRVFGTLPNISRSRDCPMSLLMKNNKILEHVRFLGFWGSPSVPGLSQDLGTLRSLMKKNIILENSWTLGLWENPSGPGTVP